MDWPFYFAAQHGKSLSIPDVREMNRARCYLLVTKAKYVKGYLIEIQFNDGTKKVIDFEP